MFKIFTRTIRKFLNNKGYEIIKLHSSEASKFGSWMEKLDIKTIVDVGSNEGQFIQYVSQSLPGRKIIAFEPIKVCYDKLIANTKQFNVTAINCGLSDHNGSTEINISENFVSSSILPMEKLHKDLYPESHYVKTQTIELKRLDDALAGMDLPKNILLKIDVQGYENKVIAGGENTIKQASVVIIEYSYAPIYEGQWLFDETYRYFTANGFKFLGVEDQAKSAKNGLPVFGDAIFVRNELVKNL